MGSYAIRTCADCGIKKPADQMHKRIVKRKAGFKSRKSVTPLTFLGAFLGSKKASGAIESWAFTTSSRKGSASANKEIMLCTVCSIKPRGGGGNVSLASVLLFPFWFPFWIMKMVFKFFVLLIRTLFSIYRFAREHGIDRKIFSFIGWTLSSLFGLAKSGGEKAMSSGEKKLYRRKLDALPDKDILAQAFQSNEFQEIVNFVLMREVASADGDFTRDERNFIRGTIEISNQATVLAEVIFESKKLLKAFKVIISEHVLQNNEFVESIISNLFAIAEIDGKVDQDELDLIENLAAQIGMDNARFNQLKKAAHTSVVKSGKKFQTSDTDKMIAEALRT